MKQLKIEKTDTGYTLRLSYGPKVSNIVLSVLFLSVGVFCLLLAWLTRDGAAIFDLHPVVYGVLGFFFTVLGAFLLYAALGLRVVVDGTGVRRYRFNRCTFDLPWKHVKSWGVTSVKTRVKYHTTEQYYVYFSAKAGERTGKNCITMPIDPKEKGELRRSGLYDFISAHRGEDVDDGYL